MFGNAKVSPQNETTPFFPRSTYGISKLAGYHLTRNYREAYGLFALNGILFNHESPRRGYEFVTRKVTGTVAKIKLGLANELRVGNLEAKRDWGYADDYIKAMWLMLQQDEPDDFVIATGKTHTVKELIEIAFGHLDLDWEDYVVVDQDFYRPAEIYELKGDAGKATKKLGWKPSVSFEDMITLMVDEDLRSLGVIGR
jgi:GDPmannose 4,6-dehydratase